MISTHVQKALGQTGFGGAPMMPQTRSTSSVSGLQRPQEVSAALGWTRRQNPVGASLLESIYFADPRYTLAATYRVEQWLSGHLYHPLVKPVLKGVARLAVLELTHLSGSHRPETRRGSAKPIGSDLVQNKGFSERECIGIVNREPSEPEITRHQWRTALKAPYGVIVSDLLGLVAEASKDLKQRLEDEQEVTQ